MAPLDSRYTLSWIQLYLCSSVWGTLRRCLELRIFNTAFFCQTATTQIKHTYKYDYFPFCCQLTNFDTNFKKCSKVRIWAPKICILLPLRIFDRGNETKTGFFFERLGSNSIPVLGLTQDQKFSNSVDNSLTQNTGAKKRWKIVRQLPKVGNFDLFSTKMSQILAWKAFNSGLKL